MNVTWIEMNKLITQLKETQKRNEDRLTSLEFKLQSIIEIFSKLTSQLEEV